MARSFHTLDDAYDFLEKLGASSKLLLHVKLVGEAAENLIEVQFYLKLALRQISRLEAYPAKRHPASPPRHLWRGIAIK